MTSRGRRLTSGASGGTEEPQHKQRRMMDTSPIADSTSTAQSSSSPTKSLLKRKKEAEEPNEEICSDEPTNKNIGTQKKVMTSTEDLLKKFNIKKDDYDKMLNCSWADIVNEEEENALNRSQMEISDPNRTEDDPKIADDNAANAKLVDEDEKAKGDHSDIIEVENDGESDQPGPSGLNVSGAGRRKLRKPSKKSTAPRFERQLELAECVVTKPKLKRRRKRSKTKESMGDDSRVLKTKRSKGDDSLKSAKKGFKATKSEEKSESNSPSSVKSVASTLNIRKGWVEPKLGWCTDETVLVRRTKEIEKAKEKPVYHRYQSEVPKNKRLKSMPRTPNKFINFSRRSWDKQVRIWKKTLYVWAGEEPTESCASSVSSISELESLEGSIDDSDDENTPSNLPIKIEADAAASLLGHMDLESQNTLIMKTDDESTLKGNPRAVLGPRDFSHMK